MVLLQDEPDAFVFEPAYGLLGPEEAEGPFDEAVAARVRFLQGADAFEGIGQVAAAAARDGDLGERRPARLQDRYGHLRRRPFQPDGAEAAGGAGTDDEDLHGAKIRKEDDIAAVLFGNCRRITS